MEEIKEIVLFFIFRLAAVGVGLYLGYIIVQKFVRPNVLDQLCLTNTENCTQIQTYRWQNTFVAKDVVSQIWVWYNGDKLYVYGQAAGTCPDQNNTSYTPVTVFSMKRDSTGTINFTQLSNECIPNIQSIIDIYVNEKKVQQTNVFLYQNNPSQINSIFSMIKNMLDNKIFIL